MNQYLIETLEAPDELGTPKESAEVRASASVIRSTFLEPHPKLIEEDFFNNSLLSWYPGKASL